MDTFPLNTILRGDCRDVMSTLPTELISACITDPPYNYEFIGHRWNDSEIQRRLDRAKAKD
ncbi:MAG: site-specific DNA-methyltransferase, partial [Merismopedia sp. SIO2A8]|nr:site-specific DNA-methyltransferase [Merismopedia sp. SIO2A8]